MNRLIRKTLVLLLFINIYHLGGIMATPEIEKKLYSDLAAAYGKSTTVMNKALAKAYKDAADAIGAAPPIVTPPPVTGSWPKDMSANPTGPKKPFADRIASFTSGYDGQVVDGLYADQITINHKNVTIRNFKTRSVLASRTGYDASGLVLEDGLINGENIAENAVMYSGYTARRVEITRTTDAFKAHGNVTIEDCWIHDLNFQTGAGTGAGGFSHNDGVQVSSGSGVKILRTRFEHTRGNAGVFIDPDQGKISYILIQENLFDDVGNYMAYVKESASNPSTGLPDNITIIANTFGKRPDYLDPNWGLMICEIRATNLIFQNNKTIDGKLVTLDSYGKGVINQ